MIRCSRAMSCAEASRLPSGGLRSAHRCPPASLTAYVRLERPPEMRSKVSGGSAPATRSANHASRLGRSIASSPMAADPMRGEGERTGLLIDFGGVLTTSVWDSFADFCREKKLEEDAVKRLFREDPEALAELRGLEMGQVSEDEFELRFAKRLGLGEASDLIDSMFRGMRPDELMVAATRDARSSGIRTGLVSNSWSTSHYDRDLLAELFDAVVISAEVGMHKPQPEIYLLAADRLGLAPARCVFVDDLRENCAGAEAVGMTAILHRDPAETIARMEELLGFEVASQAG